MLRIKPASYQDQTKSDTESEYQPKGGENSLPIENSFQKETRNDTQERKTIPRMNIRILCHIRGVGFLFVWGGGSVCVRACVCVYTHAQATVRTLPSLGIKTAFSPRAGRTKLLWAVFTSRRGQDLTYGQLSLTRCTTHKRSQLPVQSLGELFMGSGVIHCSESPHPFESSKQELLIPSGPRLPPIPWPVRGLQRPSLPHALWKAHWLPLLICSRRWVSISVRCHHLSWGDDAPSPRGWGETGEVHRCAVWMVAACFSAFHVCSAFGECDVFYIWRSRWTGYDLSTCCF